MNFLCDVHIPYKLKKFLQEQGFVAEHINRILQGDKTDDFTICRYCDENDIIFITKDSDFVDYYHLKKTPVKLIKINLGNISVEEILSLFQQYLPLIKTVAERKTYLIEMDKNNCFIAED